jgi:hypothetical protein
MLKNKSVSQADIYECMKIRRQMGIDADYALGFNDL